MKIAIFAQCMYSPWIEGIKNNSLFLVKELSKKSEVQVISHAPKTQKKDSNLDGINIHYLLKLSENKFFQFFYYFLGAFKSLFFIYKKKISIISFQYFETSFIVPMLLLACLKWNTKFTLTLYSTDELNIWYKRIIFRLLKKKIKKVIIISKYIEKQIVELGYSRENIEYIPLSFDKKRYLHFADFEKRDKKKILFSAGIIEEAGSFFMVDLAKKMPEYTFVFALRKFNKKSEQEFDLLKKYITKKGVKNIEIQRNVEKMEELLGEVGALVLPLQDIHIKMLIPVALLEALARGTPCFVSDLPHLQILAKDNSILFERGNILDLQQKINTFITNKSIAKKAYNFAKNFPDYPEIGKKYTLIFNSLT